MKPDAFAKVLKRYAVTLSHAGDEATADVVQVLADGFRDAPGASVKVVLKRAPNGDARDRDAASSEAIDGLCDLLAAANAKPAHADCLALSSAWKKTSVAADIFAEAMRSAPQKKAKSSPAKIDPKVLDDFAMRLSRALEKPSDFETIMDEIEADKRIKKAGLQKIAETVLGYPMKGLSVENIRHRLRDAPRIEALQRSRRNIIDKINV